MFIVLQSIPEDQMRRSLFFLLHGKLLPMKVCGFIKVSAHPSFLGPIQFAFEAKNVHECLTQHPVRSLYAKGDFFSRENELMGCFL